MYEDFLRMVPLFAGLPDDDLSRLCEMIHEVRLNVGETLFEEGDIADMAYITYEGVLEVTKVIDGREVFLEEHKKAGVVIGESALLEASMRLATIRATQPSLVLGLSRSQVQDLLKISPTAAQILVQTLAGRSRSMEAHVRFEQRMAEVGTLTAGLAHELNNPAAAVLRSVSQLEDGQERIEAARLALEMLGLTAEQRVKVESLKEKVREMAGNPVALDVLERSDREAELEDWLDGAGVENGWEVTPGLVDLGLNTADLADLAADFPGEKLGALVRWLAAAFTNQALLVDISYCAGRISDIVKAMKSYVFLDQAPVQNVDVNQGLADTLVVLASRIPEAVMVQRDFADGLPKITAVGSDLNQLWTELIDNALDALDGQGEIVLRTRQDGRFVVVTVEDNGSGIAPEHLPKLFGPFFTTKPPGKGAGLGLNMCYSIVVEHGGEINVMSGDGRTVFEVRLPVE